ncbi:MAG: SCO family protein [candidate division KSB1 bacterium]|nr:SCO family protein [candidate division KSB1 bacterium]
MRLKVFLCFIILFTMSASAFAADEDIEVGVIEKLGDYIPLDVFFYNENGDSVAIQDLVNKPTIFTFVYFRCPTICPRMLSELTLLMEKIDMIPGEDFTLLTISFDPTDTPEIARDKKKNYLNSVEREIPDSAWIYLTGDINNIERMTESVGYRFKKEKQDFIHPSALIITSPEGKIVRYIMGLSYLPFDVKMAVIEAAEGRIGQTINKVLLYCFSYDPQGRTYAMDITKVTGTIILFLLALFVVFLLIKGKARKRSMRQ